MTRHPRRRGITLVELSLVLTLLVVVIALLLPALVHARQADAKLQSQNNLKELALACHNFHDVNGRFPSGNDGNNFSAVAYLLPYLEQQELFTTIDFTKAMDDKANAESRKKTVPLCLSDQDPVKEVNAAYGATNYLFNAGTQIFLKDNDGVFYQDSHTRLPDITDGTSNTLLAAESLKGEALKKGGKPDVHRQHILLKADALTTLRDDTGVKDFKDGKNLAEDRCASWMDGRFLQGTFTATRKLNDEQPDANCGGAGGYSSLRSLDNLIMIAICDGSVRSVNDALNLDVWKLLSSKADGQVIPDF
jgi:type II secretory pathway pseudopilin PulG